MTRKNPRFVAVLLASSTFAGDALAVRGLENIPRPRHEAKEIRHPLVSRPVPLPAPNPALQEALKNEVKHRMKGVFGKDEAAKRLEDDLLKRALELAKRVRDSIDIDVRRRAKAEIMGMLDSWLEAGLTVLKKEYPVLVPLAPIIEDLVKRHAYPRIEKAIDRLLNL